MPILSPSHCSSPLAAGHGAALAGIWGALLADAVGATFEYKSADQIPMPARIQLVMPPEYPKTYPGIPFGTWSDDGSQLLCLLASLACGAGRLDLNDFGRRLLDWLDNGRHQAGGIVFDIGGQTRHALERLRQGIPAELAGMSLSTRDKGNGALMRVLPAALTPELWGTSSAEAVAIGMQQSRVTHGHALSMVTCGLYTQLARLIIERADCPPVNGWRAWVADAALLLRKHPAMTPELQVALDVLLKYGRNEMPTGAGYVADTFWSAIWSLTHEHSYLGAVRKAITMGQDTDTTACVTGGLAALAYGLDDVPAAWWGQLHVPAESAELLRSLLA